MRRLISGLTALTALGFAGVAAGSFRRTGTTLDPLEPSEASVLVTTGANSISRNPMYVGLAGTLLANSIRLGSWQALGAAAAFVAVMDRRQIASEETALASKFGADYESYRARVPRWLGLTSLRAADGPPRSPQRTGLPRRHAR